MSWDILQKGNLQYLLTKLKGKLDLKVDAVTGKGLSTNDYTTAEKSKLAGIESGAQVNTVNSDDISGSITVTGNPIALTDGSETYAEELSVDLDPIQDLHGYDKPWAGGAGKNLLPMTVDGIKSVNGGASSWSGNTKTINGVVIEIMTDNDNNVTGIKMNGTSTGVVQFLLAGTVTIPNGLYIYNIPDLINITEVWVSIVTPNTTITVSSEKSKNVSITEGTITRPYIYVNEGRTLNNVIFKPMLRSSSETDPTFESYTNISPIQGYDIVSVDRCGKNLLNPNATGVVRGKTILTDGTLTDASYISVSDYIPVKNNATLTLKTSAISIGGYNRRIVCFDNNKQYLGTCVETSGNPLGEEIITGTVIANTTFVRVPFLTTGSTNQLEEGSTATTYEAYNGQTVSLQLGNKNLLPMTVEGIKAANTSGTWSGNVYTISNGTFTILTDENGLVVGIKINGTFNAQVAFVLSNTNVDVQGKTELFNGMPSSGLSSTTRFLNVEFTKTDNTTGNWNIYENEYSSGMFSTTIKTIDRLLIYVRSGQSLSNELWQPMVRDSSVTDPTFSPYNPTLGGMVYGGQLTLKDDGSAVFVGTHGYKDCGDLTWTSDRVSGKGQFRADLTNSVYNESRATLICSSYEATKSMHYTALENNTICISNSQSMPFLRIRDDRYVSTSASDFKTAVKGVQVVYELYTPFTIHLSAEQLKLLKGYNYISSNGTTIHLTYQPDNAVGDAVSKAEKYTDRLCKTGVVDTFNLYNGNTKVGSVSLLSNGFKLLYINSTDDGTSFSMYIPDKYVPKGPYQRAVVCLMDSYANPRIIEIYSNRIIVTEDKFEQGATYGTGLYY